LKRRIVLCMGEYCNLAGRAEPLYALLERQLGPRGPAWLAGGPVRWEIVTCLSMCGGGPNLIIYPEEAVHNYLDAATLARILSALPTVDEA
jgi:NADH:ubiquinone oxidoreductase subunit E